MEKDVGTAADLTIVPIALTGGGTRLTQSREDNGDDKEVAMLPANLLGLLEATPRPPMPIFTIAGGNSSPSSG